MDTPEFKDFAKFMVDYIGEYRDTIADRPVLAAVSPGYMRPLLPDEAPETPDKWQDVMADIERVIMPGVTHWQSPHFHAYVPAIASYPDIVADMLAGAIGCVGFSWIASPACTELEVVMMDWLGKMLALPEEFLASSGGKGGGVIQCTSSDATLMALLGAKAKILKRAKEETPDIPQADITPKLVGYCSAQAHMSVERAGLLGGVAMRLLETDDKFSLRGDVLRSAIERDREQGLIPFYVVATLGTTSCCSFDNLREIGEVCASEGVWLHVDAAYAGAAFICPEFRYLNDGIELVDSFCFDPHKWMLVTYFCSAMWFKDHTYVTETYRINPVYLEHGSADTSPRTEYRLWHVQFGRRFRALKLWFVLRLYGVRRLQGIIRGHVALAKQFEENVSSDDRFELVCPASMGVVCFRIKGSNKRNEALLSLVNGGGKIHIVPSNIRGVYFLRFAVCALLAEPADVEFAWTEVRHQAEQLGAREGRGVNGLARQNGAHKET